MTRHLTDHEPVTYTGELGKSVVSPPRTALLQHEQRSLFLNRNIFALCTLTPLK